ncbi:DUF3488 domain-containing protein, partial [bacterium]|nr:DUF3488 domain-containing protein [bacterium]
MSSTSRTASLATLVSATGILSLALADLMPWPLALVLLALHAAVFRGFTLKAMPGPALTLITLAMFLLEAVRVYLTGWDNAVYGLRDLIVYFAVMRLAMPKTGREIYQIIGISIVECILSTIFTLSPLFLIGLVILAGLVPMILSGLDEEDFGAAVRKHEGMAHWTKVWAGITITSCLLFFIIPRPSSTIFRQSLISKPRTGYSEELHLDRESGVYTDTSIVMRIIWGQGRPPGTFYLSGARLDELTEQGFTRGSLAYARFAPQGLPSGSMVIYPTGIDAMNVFYPLRIANISPAFCHWRGINLYWRRFVPPFYEVWVNDEPDMRPAGRPAVPKGLDAVASLGRRVAGDGPARVKAERLARFVKTRCT